MISDAVADEIGTLLSLAAPGICLFLLDMVLRGIETNKVWSLGSSSCMHPVPTCSKTNVVIFSKSGFC